MQIKNTGSAVRGLSHRGADHTLTPGAWVDVPVTKDEAEGYRALGFEVTGEPEAAPVPPAERKGAKE